MRLHVTGPHKASSGAQGTPPGGSHGQSPWSGHSALQLSWEPPARLLHIGTSSLHTLLNSQVGGRDRVEKEYHLHMLLREWLRGSNLTLLVSSSSVKQDDVDHCFPPPCSQQGIIISPFDMTFKTARRWEAVINVILFHR